MAYQPIPLINFGAKCYLNSGIQAISSCSHFVKEIDALYPNNDDLRKFQLFKNLIKSMNGAAESIDISKNDIFKAWTKSGQQDSFELLAHVINQVFDEIRQYKETKGEIQERNLEEWLKIKLPLRMNMNYEIICECGKIDKSPLQSEIALHVSFPKKNSRILSSFNFFYSYSEVFDHQKLLDDHFQEDEIESYECGNRNCKKKKANRKLKLHYPLPNTICIHLQRSFWNGSIMEKINNTVIFYNRIAIKGEYMTRREDIEDEGDVYYYLKSVIVHYGEESSGHYICYRKYNNTWYYTSDTNIHVESAQRVFECNPYILFYEREDEEEIIPTIIKVKDNLNIFINAISSCAAFIKWLNKEKINNKSETIKRLIYLTDLANGNIARNEKYEEGYIKYWCNKNDVYETMNNIFSEINSTNYGGMEENINYFVQSHSKVPFLFIQSGMVNCECKDNTQYSRSLEMVIQLSFTDDHQYYEEIPSVQNFLDKYFTIDQVQDSGCGCGICDQRKSLLTRQLEEPLPDILCIYMNVRTSFRTFQGKLRLDNKIIIKNKFIKKSEDYKVGEEIGKEYYLKSVITEEECIRSCNGLYYKINKYKVKEVYLESIVDNYCYILFYDTIKPQKVNKNSFSDANIRLNDNIIILPKIININEYVNSFINAISSCLLFVKKLKEVKEESFVKLEHLLYMIDSTSENEENNQKKNQFIKEKWCQNVYNVDEVMKDILNGVFEEILTKKRLQKEDLLGFRLVRRIYCGCNYKVYSPSEAQWDITVTIKYPPQELQILVDQFFEKESKIEGKVCDNINCEMKDGKQKYKLCLPLSKTICIQIKKETQIHKINISKNIIIKRENCVDKIGEDYSLSRANNTSYDLRSVILADGKSCYRKIDNIWYKITNKESSKVQEDVVLSCEPSFVFYESEDFKFLDKYLSCIIRSLSSCSIFVEWLNTVKTERSLIKGDYICDRINKINNKEKEEDINERVIQGWNDRRYSDIYELLKTILKDLEEECEVKIGIEKTSLPILIFNLGSSSSSSSQSSMFIDVQIPNNTSSRKTLQQLWNEHLELLSNKNSKIKRMQNKITEKCIEIVFEGILPATICFHLSFPCFIGRAPFMLELRNELCSQYQNKGTLEDKDCLDYEDCCRKYHLKSFIDKDNQWYKVCNDKVYICTESQSSLVQEETLLNINIIILFYE